MMTHDEMIAVIKAHKEGKEIQYSPKCSGGNWYNYSYGKQITWNFEVMDYRIKPEPHYRPFKNADEVMAAIKEHGDWFKVKESGDLYQVVGFVNMMFMLGQDGIRDCKKAFDNFTFTDGTPFGVKEE